MTWYLHCDHCDDVIPTPDGEDPINAYAMHTPCRDTADGEHVHGTTVHFCSESCLAAWAMAAAMDVAT